MPPKRKTAMPPKRPGASKKYSVAPLIEEGEIVTDFSKKKWRLGKSFASGGFGRIYHAKPLDSAMKGNFVIKAEPAENGPLFQEFHVYCRIFKPDMIEKYKRLKGLDFLGVPAYYGAGLHEKSDLTHRFLILPLFGSDLEKIRESQTGGKLAGDSDVFRLVLNCLNIYEYLHDSFYVHADLKADNLLLAESQASSKIWQCFLLDYGLAKKVPEHPTYKEQPKKAHDGTLIFTSLDAHRGCAPTYRGDLEILAYNTVYWLTGTLPWLKLQSSPDRVFESKTKFRTNLHQELAAIVGAACPYLKDLEQFFVYSYSLNYSDKPDFDRLRRIVGDMLKKSVAPSASDNLKIKPKRINSEPVPSNKTTDVGTRLRKRSKASSSSERDAHMAPSPTKAAKLQSPMKAVRTQSPTKAVKSRSPIKPVKSRIVRTIIETDDDSDQDLFEPVPKSVSIKPKYIPRDVEETADSSSTDEDYCPSPPLPKPTVRRPVNNKESLDLSEDADDCCTMTRPPIRKLEAKKSSAPKIEAKNKLKNSASRRLSMLEAAIVKKYCKPIPSRSRVSVKSRLVRNENGADNSDSDHDTTENGTQTSPAMWTNRKKNVP